MHAGAAAQLSCAVPFVANHCRTWRSDMQNFSRIRSGLVHALLATALLLPSAAAARQHTAPAAHIRVTNHHRVTGVPRDHHGRILRSASAKGAFKKLHPCPATGRSRGRCPGYVIDHIKPLACGGPDAPVNMHWQTLADGKAKDKWERKACGGQ